MTTQLTDMPTNAFTPMQYNMDALAPLYQPSEQPDKHRSRNPNGGAALIQVGRRPSKCLLVPQLRHQVDMWRHNQYAGASMTSQILLQHWFGTAHPNDFRYHFCQREAIETLIWLYEVAQYRDLSAMYSSLFEDEADAVLLKSITPFEDAWARYCSKLATGSGKTKCMPLAIVWSYFHSLLEKDSDLARHFLVVAPNIIVFERLKSDFQNRHIFLNDPVLPPEWKDDFDLQVVLQDEAGGTASQGTLYLTNIHRLYERGGDGDTNKTTGPAWAGPVVKRAKALKVGQALRERITAHPRLLVLNDEAHHLHDPDSAWNEALESIDSQSRARGNGGICAQLDFTATPKDAGGNLFRYITCDFPLGEAVDAGIVKVPVIGKSDELKPLNVDNAAQKWSVHLKLGYKQYEFAYQEWEKTHKPILFVMTESTTAADEIAAALDSDEYPLLKGRVVNLHTKLKGKVKKVKGSKADYEFVEDEKGMSDEDLSIIRQISRDLDTEDSPYRCVVSVLMLREGWDVRNVTTIVPLRAFSAGSGILAEQTLGRGLRRMTRPGDVAERVTVVEHSMFAKLYEDELAEEGLPISVTPISTTPPPKVTVSIFVDPEKDSQALDVELPVLTASLQTTATLSGITFAEVRDAFQKKYQPLPILKPRGGTIEFQERALFTDELIASWNIDRGLLQMGYGAISVFVTEMEKATGLQGAHAVLAPLLQQFIEEVLFERSVDLFGGDVNHRMGNSDVAEHIRATFTPLIRARTVKRTERTRNNETIRVSGWKPYQATSTALRPCVSAQRTMFNLVSCDNDLERAFVDFCDMAEDVEAFARNTGPQKLMIDYLAPNGRPALYLPDFFVRAKGGNYFLVEMKGQEDTTVPLKARAAVEWCRAASTKTVKWAYMFVPMAQFEANSDFAIETLARACAPRLKQILDSAKTTQLELSLEMTPTEVKLDRTAQMLAEADVTGLPETVLVYVAQAINQLAFDRIKNYPQFGAAFQPLLVPLEQLCGDLMMMSLSSFIPPDASRQRDYFDPDLRGLEPRDRNVLIKFGSNLKRNLAYGANCNRIGTLLFCLEYASPTEWQGGIGGVWADVKRAFNTPQAMTLYPWLDQMNKFRNKHVAHVDEPLTDGDYAHKAMILWIKGLSHLYNTVYK